MEKRHDWRAPAAALAAASGAGFSSGRCLVFFFAQLGGASWVAVGVASAAFGLLMGLMCHWAGRMGTDSFVLLCRRLLPGRANTLASGMYGALLGIAALGMLGRAGDLGAMTLPIHNGCIWGMAAALLIALALNLTRLRGLPAAGLVVLTVGIAFYAALAVDARPVRMYIRGEVELALEGSVPAAVLLGLSYAAMNATLAAGAAARFSGPRPEAVATVCALTLGGILLCVNGAILRGGRQLIGQQLPIVVLSARWGLPGFWICAGFGFLCACLTLTASLSGLIDLVLALHR